MSEISINPAALHMVSSVFSNNDVKEVEETESQIGVGAPVFANLRTQGVDDNEAIVSSAQAKEATAASSRLIKSDALAAMMAQANQLPSDVLDLLDD